MTVQNADVARILREVGDLLAVDGANEFRVRAYRDAATTLERLSDDIAERVQDGEDLTELEGIGDDLAEKIEEIVETGRLEQLDALRDRVPPGLADVLDLPDLGAERVRTLHEELGIEGIDDLEAAAREGNVQEVEGFGERMEEQVLDAIEQYRERAGRFLWSTAEDSAEALAEHLRGIDAAREVIVAGSFRRKKATVGDLDVLVVTDDPGPLVERFVGYDHVEDVEAEGERHATVRLASGLTADLLAVPEEEKGSALFHWTGAKAHNVALRRQAQDRGWTLHEHGLFEEEDDEEGECLAGATEDELYDAFDLAWIPPELREDEGEFEAARDDELPDLITLEDLRGDLQCHTTASDGRADLREMAETAQTLGHEYLAITDHAGEEGVLPGLDADELRSHWEAMDDLQDDLDDLTLLRAVEVNVLEDGSLSLPDDVLEDAELVVAGLHSQLDLDRDEQTDRIVRALEHPLVRLLVHPTCRRLGERDPLELDFDRILEAARDHDTWLEINAQPDRLDLPPRLARRAKRAGVPLAIDTDAHGTGELEFLRHGIHHARRAWLTAADVINTLPLDELRDHL